MAESHPTSPGLQETIQVLAARHGAYYPQPPAELQRHLELPSYADAEGIRNAYEAWCQLYESMTEEDEAPAIREKNQANLDALKALRPAMERHAESVHIWRLLGEANARIKRRSLAESRILLHDARERLHKTASEPLQRWLNTLIAEFTHAGGELDPGASRLAATEPAPAPAKRTAEPANTAAADPARAPAAQAPEPKTRTARPRLVPPARATATTGEAVNLNIKVENPPARLTMTGLPPGVVWLHDGTIRGRPSRPGTYRVTITAESAGGADSATLLFVVDPAPAAAAASPPPPPAPAPAPPVKSAAVPAAPPASPVPRPPAPPPRKAPAPPPPEAARPKPAAPPRPVAPPPHSIQTPGTEHTVSARLAPAAPRPPPRAPAPPPAAPPPAAPVPVEPPRPPAPARPAAPAPEAPPAPPADRTGPVPALAGDRFTLRRPDGRRLHVLAAARLRIGRGDSSDLAVAALARGNPTRTVAVTREISRKHCEIALDARGASVRDGWSDDGKPSKFGTFLDDTPVPLSPTALRTGGVLRITSQPSGPDCPHWRIQLLEAVAAPDGGPSGPSLHLARLDHVGDDILLLQGPCDLHALGLAKAPCRLWHDDDGFRCTAGGRVESASALERHIPGAALEPAGTLRPHTVEELVRSAGSAPHAS